MEKKFIDITEEIYAQFTEDIRQELMEANDDTEKKYLASESIGLLMSDVIKEENLASVTTEDGHTLYQMIQDAMDELIPFLEKVQDIIAGCIKDGLLPLQEEDAHRLVSSEFLQHVPLYMEEEKEQ